MKIRVVEAFKLNAIGSINVKNDLSMDHQSEMFR